jgi:hypothetical protein
VIAMPSHDKFLLFFGCKLSERQQCALERLARGQTKSDVFRGYLDQEAQRLELATAAADVGEDHDDAA